jgi:hypothetical protein
VHANVATVHRMWAAYNDDRIDEMFDSVQRPWTRL